ncbi:GNAT family N-acetyltransferase [Acinetobacter oleivorans]|uniref:GNAT family N-acetyltransferase n=1 Tax=Acinetobacter oleivorans TaxID=1148157 RepID=UPI001250653C|nr:GNAT family N-acetyltransferase [Acinetobacter oleivorans]
MHSYENKELDEDVLSFMRMLDLNTQSLGQDNIRVLLDSNRVILACAFIEYGEKQSEIFVFGVGKDHQGLGIGKYFAEKVLNELKESRCCTVVVDPINEVALMFWVKMGFNPIPDLYNNLGYPKLNLKLN